MQIDILAKADFIFALQNAGNKNCFKTSKHQIVGTDHFCIIIILMNIFLSPSSVHKLLRELTTWKTKKHKCTDQ